MSGQLADRHEHHVLSWPLLPTAQRDSQNPKHPTPPFPDGETEVVEGCSSSQPAELASSGAAGSESCSEQLACSTCRDKSGSSLQVEI